MSVPGATPSAPDPTPYPPSGQPAPQYAPEPQYGPQSPQYAPPPQPQYAPPYGPPQYAPQYGDPQYAAPYVQYASPKNLLAATLLCFFLGVFGIHRFYVGKVGTGIAQLLTAGGFGIWVLIDLILLICQAFKDRDGYTLRWDTVR